MANRFGQQFTFSLIKQVWHVYAKVTFGAAGAPTLVQGSPAASPGVISVAKTNTGRYLFTFGTQTGMLDVWPRLLGVRVVFDAGVTGPVAPVLHIVDDNTAVAGTCTIEVGVSDLTGLYADPGSGEVGYFEFVFSNSTAT